jgi:muramoyltetrapeptide carboxypeptidase
MMAKRLDKGDTIGIFCPGHIGDIRRYERICYVLEGLGFKVRLGANMFKDTNGYAAGAEERAADFYDLVADDTVKAVLFSGGDGGVEVLPHIDFGMVGRKPKLYGSYSDGTSILNAVLAQTGLVVYYGTAPGVFGDLRYYDCLQFFSHFVEGFEAERFERDSEWAVVNDGKCEGTLVGGYTSLFVNMLSNKYFRYDDKKYLLVLEAHERYHSVGAVASDLAFVAQSAFMGNVAGLVFGHYAKEAPEALMRCLERFGRDHGIPVVYTDDFGHGTRHGVLPFGVRAKLDAEAGLLEYCK